MIFLLLQGVYFQLFVCKVIRLYNLPLQLTEQNKRTECLRKSITYRPCSRRGKSSLSQGRSSDSFPPLRLPSLKPVAKSARSCPIRAETHSNGYCRRFSRHSLIILEFGTTYQYHIEGRITNPSTTNTDIDSVANSG